MNQLNGKRLALLGTEVGAQEAADYCRKNGITTVSFGNKPEAKLHQFTDEQCIVDCTDAEVMLPLLKEKKIDGVFLSTSETVNRKCIEYLSGTDFRLYTTLNQWDTLMNKANFKHYAGAFGINTVPEYPIDPEKGTIPENITFPVVVKPTDNCGSFGTSICRTMEEVKQAIEEARSRSLSGTVICEKCLTGDYFSFEMWMQNGKAYFPFVKQRVLYPKQGTHPEQTFLDISPASFSELIAETFYNKLEKLFLSLGIYNGQCFFQGIIDDGIPYIMDNGFRISGGQNWKVIREEKGVGLIESYIQYALSGNFGGDFSALNRPMTHSYAFICIGLKNGQIDKIRGMDEIKALPYVISVYQYYEEGQTITTSGLFTQALCRILVKADDRTQLKTRIENILSYMEVSDAGGKSMLLDYPDIAL